MFQDLAKMSKTVGQIGRYLGQAARLMVGMPDYDAYVQHMRVKHPDEPIMTYEVFFRQRQEARYEGGKGSCC